MRIKFLGTSSFKSFPRLNCKCEQCLSKNKKDKRLRSSVIIDDKILIDAGPDIEKQVKIQKLNIKNIEAIIITHCHNDHTDGLKYLMPKISANCQIFLSKKTYFKLPILKKYNKKIIFIKNNDKLKIADLDFRFIEIPHFRETNYTVPIINNKVIHATDFSEFTKTFLQAIKEAKILILDGSMLNHSGFGHMGIEKQLKVLCSMFYDLRLTIIYTHNGHNHIPHQQLENQLQELVNSKHIKSIKLAYDKMQIKI